MPVLLSHSLKPLRVRPLVYPHHLSFPRLKITLVAYSPVHSNPTYTAGVHTKHLFTRLTSLSRPFDDAHTRQTARVSRPVLTCSRNDCVRPFASSLPKSFDPPPLHPTKKPSGNAQRPRASPLQEFFKKYRPKFEYNPAQSASLEFYRLCDQFKWERDDPKRGQAHTEFQNALVKQFNKFYGMDEKDIANWQNLCYVIRIQPIPGNLKACRKAVRARHVNLVDLIDTFTTGKKVQLFSSVRTLSEYTISTGKYFPLDNPYAGGLLRHLLRHILHPPTRLVSRRKTKKRR